MELSSENNPITENGVRTHKIIPGRYYSFGASGIFDGGTLYITSKGSDGLEVAFPDSPLTISGGFLINTPDDTLVFTLVEATAPNILIKLAPVS